MILRSMCRLPNQTSESGDPNQIKEEGNGMVIIVGLYLLEDKNKNQVLLVRLHILGYIKFIIKRKCENK